MNKFQPMKQLVCADCGIKFFGINNLYCDDCRKVRRSHRKVQKKICPICHKERRMFEKQVICRLCMSSIENSGKKAQLTIKQAADRIKARRTGGQLKKIKTCPNFDGANMACVVCEPGSWEFKDCGGSK